MSIEKISQAKPLISTRKISFKGESEEQNITQQKTSNNTKGVVTFLSILGAIGAAGVAIYEHKNAKELAKKAKEEAKKEAKEKIAEAEKKAKEAAENVEKQIKEAVEKAKKELLGKKKDAETKIQPTKTNKIKKNNKKTSKKDNLDNTKTSKPSIEKPTIETEETNKPQVTTPKAEIKESVDNESKPNFWIRIKILFNKNQSSEAANSKEPKPNLWTKIKNLFNKNQSSEAANSKEPKPNFWTKIKNLFNKNQPSEASTSTETKPNFWVKIKILFNTPAKETIPPETSKSSFWTRFKNLFKKKEKTIKTDDSTKSVDTKTKKSSDNTDSNTKTNSIKDKNNEKILEGGIKDTELTEIDENFIKRYKEGQNGIIFIPRATKLSNFVEKTYNYLLEKINSLKNIFKTKSSVTKKEKANNEKIKESKKLVAELEKKLNGNISVSVPKKPTNFEHNKLQKEYDELAILPEKRKHKTLLELKEQIAAFWKKQSNDKVKQLEKELNGNISVSVPHKPTYAEHNKLQKEYDELAILPEKRKHKTLLELKEQIAAFWKKQSDDKVKQLEKELNGNISVRIPEKPTEVEHDKLQKEYDELAILPKKRTRMTNAQRKIAFLKDIEETYNRYMKLLKKLKITDKKVTKSKNNEAKSDKVKKLEKELNGNISVSVPKKPTNFEHNKLQKEYDELAILPERRKHKTLLELKEQIAAFWKKQSDDKVKKLEKELNGNISVRVPEKPTEVEHDKLQKEYDELAILPKKRTRMTNAQRKIAFLKDIEETYNRYVKLLKRLKVTNKKASESKNYVADLANDTKKQENKTLQVTGATTEQAQKSVTKGINELPESFNMEERIRAKYIYRKTNAPEEKVTEFPKLYAQKEDRKKATKIFFRYIIKDMWHDIFAPKATSTGNFWQDIYTQGVSPIVKLKEYFKLLKEEKNAKKAYQKAKNEHIIRRVNTFRNHVGGASSDVAVYNRYIITEDTKFHGKRYKSMAQERPNAEDWEPEMTREELMKDKYKYVQEAYKKELSY